MTKIRHAIFDLISGNSLVRGRDGRDHTLAAVEAAERLAAAGDEAAIALLASLDIELDDDYDVIDLLEQQVHDCPECRAAMARGERPTFEVAPSVIPRSIRRRMMALNRKQKN